MLPYSPRSVLAASRTAGHFAGRCAPLLRTTREFELPQSRRSVVTNVIPNAKTPTTTTTTTTTTTADTQPSKNDAPSISISDQIRLLMRRVPYPVAIITATDPHGPPEKAFRGMTVSSFNTVTLSPEPVISFNVRRPSETLSALQSSTRFLVHLLAPRPATAALARDFSKGNHNLSIMAGKSEYGFVSHPPVLSSDETSARPLPLLQRKEATESADREDFPFVFECRLHPQGIQVHDHTIVVGTVVRALSGPLSSLDSETKASDLCLTYANTRFWEMGHQI
ncbi:oxidoreductase [Aspergillus ellipticus CBS 707.79]|uniref:Oxidoreductase n=1 Tax=Aspergillus ellipticus CBS 707.79 TaxID=1448320 RepID=A0A319D305_9EURO|nr:oxidoreductase [Aspergillus ellipticus CBS 707.79]